MTKVVVTGVAGRMGREIVRLVRAAEGLSLYGAVEQPGPAVGLDAGTVAGLGSPVGLKVQAGLAEALAGADVVIDFTGPEASAAHATLCAERGVAIVIGSTGFSADAKSQVERAAKRVPVIPPNMSVGVNVLFELVRQAARALGQDYDVEIVEIHHKHKRDAPSGTAVRLGEVAAEALGRVPADALCFTRRGITGERPPWQIGIRLCAAVTWWASTRSCSVARASGSSSSTEPPRQPVRFRRGTRCGLAGGKASRLVRHGRRAGATPGSMRRKPCVRTSLSVPTWVIAGPTWPGRRATCGAPLGWRCCGPLGSGIPPRRPSATAVLERGAGTRDRAAGSGPSRRAADGRKCLRTAPGWPAMVGADARPRPPALRR